jgi:uncharacterized RDD family membrane protein YckC
LRLGARLLDGVLAFFAMVLGGLTVTAVFLVIYRGDLDAAPGPVFGVPMITVLLGVPFLYEWLQVSKWGATVGKRAMGIRVVDTATSGPIGPGPVPKGRAALRALCYSPGVYHVPFYIPVLGQLNVLWMLWDRPLRQCLHDKAAKTVVVRGTVAPPAPVRLEGEGAASPWPGR